MEFNDVPINGTSGADSLFRADYTMRASGVGALQVPTVRLRSNSGRNVQSAAVQISSTTGNGFLITDTYKTYPLYFGLPSAEPRFRLFFDIMNFDSSDAASATLQVEAIEVSALSVSGLGFGRDEKT